MLLPANTPLLQPVEAMGAWRNRGRDRKLATSPIKGTSGLHSVSDLLFSPRVAFIWNHTRKSVVWMNPAARAVFALRLEDFSASLPPALVRRFSHCVEKQMAVLAKVKVPHGRTLDCSVEILKLAAGEDGLIVAELSAAEGRLPAFHAPPIPRKAVQIPKRAVRRAPRRAAKAGQKAEVPALSADEMRAFKSVGRKVLRLCEEKKHVSALPTAAPPPPSSRPGDSLTPDRAAQSLRDVLSAFDLVLFLSDGLDVVKVEGRTAQFGWRRARLIGKPVAGLLAPQDQAAVNRIVRTLRSPSRRSGKALTLRAGAGSGVACRAVAGSWEQDGAAFFLAFLSLEPRQDAKRRQPAGSARTPLAA